MYMCGVLVWLVRVGMGDWAWAVVVGWEGRALVWWVGLVGSVDGRGEARRGTGRHRAATTPTFTSLLSVSMQNKKVTEFLKTILGRPVIVKLNSGVDYRGACG